MKLRSLIFILLGAGLIYWVLQFFILQLEPEYLSYRLEKATREEFSPQKLKSTNAEEEILKNQQFNLWVMGCTHMMSDFKRGRLGIAEAFRQSEFGYQGAPVFDWQVQLNLGDFVTYPHHPDEFQGLLASKQLSNVVKHKREQIYSLMGNHDAWTVDSIPERNFWFRTWIDPLGEHPTTSNVKKQNRPFPIEGTYERYAFEVGNVLILMLSDMNDGAYPVGRENRKDGCPAGAISLETFEWWKKKVLENEDKIIITCHHVVPRATTIASAPYDGLKYKFHGQCSPHDVKGSSYLYFIGEEPNSDKLTDFMEDNPGCIDLWLGAHTHISPLDTIEGKTFCERKYDITFVNCAKMFYSHSPASSRLFEFALGKKEVLLRTYIHKSDSLKTGFLSLLDKKIPLRHEFRFE